MKVKEAIVFIVYMLMFLASIVSIPIPGSN